MIAILTEFLLKTGNSVFFFTTIRDALKQFNHFEEYLETMQQFVEHRKIKIVPEDALQELISYFLQCQKIEVLQKLILHLDLKQVEISQLLVVCIEQMLLRPLIYICTKTHDFLTPLVKMFGLFVVKKQQRVGNRCLWYLRLCLSQRYITGEKIWEDRMPELLKNIIPFIFVSENLKSLIDIDAAIALRVL